jgi:RNA polymerase sigma-70 factor (ECF subfamily)
MTVRPVIRCITCFPPVESPDTSSHVSMANSTPRHYVPFHTTRWSIVASAGGQRTTATDAALSTLCQTYWQPLYAFLRRSGRPAAEAQDLVQEFFATLLEKDYLAAADRERGRFRTFLLTLLKRFASHQRERGAALKRGGGQTVLSLDFDSAEQSCRLEPADGWTPEREFERRWALTLLDRVLSHLAAEYRERGRDDLFQRCRVFLTGETAGPSYAEVASSLGMTEGAVKVTIHRLRQRYRELLRNEIKQTVAAPEDVADELNHLLAALRRD